MASTYSTNLGIELPGTGDQAGVWGNTTNTNLGTLIEQAISGYVTQAVATGTDTTITIPNGATGVARNMYIELTGTGGASTNLIVPANKKLYFIFNNTSSGQVTVKVSGQTGISVPNGKKMILVSNGTDIVTAENYVASLSSDNLTLTGTLAVGSTSTFTGAATFTANPVLNGGTANGVLYLNGSKVATSGSALTFDGTLLSVGGGTNGTRFAVKGSAAFGGFDTGAATDGRIEYAYNGTNIFYTSMDSSSLMTLMARSGVSLAFGANGSEGMRLTSTGLGIGTSSPAYKLDITSASDADLLQIKSTASANNTVLRLGISGNDAVINASGDSTGSLAFKTYGTERMRLDSSGNLGIGTASPQHRLDVNRPSYGVTARFYTSDGTNNPRLVIYGSAAGTTIQNTFSTSAANLMFAIGGAEGSGTEVARFDNTGNFGLGVTPSAWGNNYKGLEIVGAGAAIAANGSNAVTIGTGNYINSAGNWIYTTTGTAVGRYELNSGLHRWYNAPSGTAGNTITFTQAMTLDANGVLFAGAVDSVSSGVRALFTGSVASVPVVKIKPQSVNGVTLLGDHYGADESVVTLGIAYSSGATIIGNTVAPSTSNDTGFISTQDTFACRGAAIRLDGSAGVISFWNSNTNSTVTTGSARTLTQAMILNASGNLSLAEGNAPTQVLSLYRSGSTNAIMSAGNSNTGLDGTWFGVDTVGNGIVNVRGSFPLLFSTNANERGQFTAGGYFKASNSGTYDNATGSYHEIRQTTNNPTVLISNTVASFTGANIQSGVYGTVAGTGFSHIGCLNSAAATVFQVRGDGNAYNTNGTYGTISDERLKQDIVDADSQWDDIKAVRFRKYRMKADVEVNPDAPAMFGLVAQELEQTSPGLVDELVDRDAEGNDLGTKTKSVKTSILLMKAAKALQEAMARIEQLEADMAALKGAK